MKGCKETLDRYIAYTCIYMYIAEKKIESIKNPERKLYKLVFKQTF